ncbi:MAG: hypothetical protein K6D02_05195 [Lachnospiraceae bacterium]|nr:hypothetical protein [Lachnospiraceae bacterium]
MKRKLALVLVAGTILVGCGNNVQQNIPQESNGREFHLQEENVTDESEESTEISIADSSVEVANIELLKGFLGVEGDKVEAVSDVDISIDSYDGDHFFDYVVGDNISIEQIKEGIRNSGWGDEMVLSYMFLYEESSEPILIVRVADNPNYPDENNCLLFFAEKNEEVHLVSYNDTMTDEYTYSYVGNNGIISYNSQPLGRNNANIIDNVTYIVNAEGKMEVLFNETLAGAYEAEYMGDDHRAFALFADMYDEGNYSYISVAEWGSDKYYTLYSDDSDPSLDTKFIETCEKEGIKVYNREELLPLVNIYISELGYDIDMAELDKHEAKWQELD